MYKKIKEAIFQTMDAFIDELANGGYYELRCSLKEEQKRREREGEFCAGTTCRSLESNLVL